MSKNMITQQDVDEIIQQSGIDVVTAFNKCTIVTVKLPSGFIIVESSACVDSMK